MPLFSIFAAYNITRKFPDDYISATISINSEVCTGTYYASSNHPCYVQFYKQTKDIFLFPEGMSNSLVNGIVSEIIRKQTHGHTSSRLFKDAVRAVEKKHL